MLSLLQKRVTYQRLQISMFASCSVHDQPVLTLATQQTTVHIGVTINATVQAQDMAEYLGIDADDEADLRDIAKMAVAAPTPPGWQQIDTPDGSGMFRLQRNPAAACKCALVIADPYPALLMLTGSKVLCCFRQLDE